jgi:hypothetical protein
MSPFEFASKYSSDDTMREKLYPLFETVFQIEYGPSSISMREGSGTQPINPIRFLMGMLPLRMFPCSRCLS